MDCFEKLLNSGSPYCLYNNSSVVVFPREQIIGIVSPSQGAAKQMLKKNHICNLFIFENFVCLKATGKYILENLLDSVLWET